jgi:hypothetical protein
MSCILLNLEEWHFSVAALMNPGTIEHKYFEEIRDSWDWHYMGVYMQMDT